LRGKRPGSAIIQTHSSVGDVSKVEKSVKGKGGKAVAVEKEVEAEVELEHSEPPPKTYVLKEPYEFYKPRINVEMDNPDKLDTVTEIHIRGWKIEKPIMEVFNLCLQHVDRLHTIRFVKFFFTIVT
jgi:hypothetical protein